MILLELYTAIFAAALAWLNRIPCKKMIDFGASIREEKEFHRVNAIAKIIFVIIIVFVSKQHGGIISMIIAAFLLLTIMWTVFDVVLSKLLHNDWFYIGLTSKIDKRFRTIFGEKEGLWKLLICCIVILTINFFL